MNLASGESIRDNIAALQVSACCCQCDKICAIGVHILPPGLSTSPFALDLISSILPRAKLMAGTTHPPQLHLMPCQAYLPMFILHLAFGHSSRPSSLPCSNSGRIQDNGSTKRCAQCEVGLGTADCSSEIGPVSLISAELNDFGTCGTR